MEEKSRSSVLFADRHLEWSRPVRERLRREGVRVCATSTTRDLLNELTRHPPDLIVLDEDLEEMGLETLTGLIRQRAPLVPVVLITEEGAPSGSAGGTISAVRSVARSGSPELLQQAVAEFLLKRGDAAPRPRLIMCVDDERPFLESLARLLRRAGYRVVSYLKPEEAQEALPFVKPDLIFMDVLMPGMNGFDLSDEIREDFGRIPVVFITARGSDQEILNGYRHGATYYVTKPCDPRMVVNIADYFLRDLDSKERRLLEARL